MYREKEMYPLLAKFLRSRGYEPIIGFYPLDASRVEVDVLGYNKQKQELVSVEVKISGFSKILRQVDLRMLFSDYVYVAFPEKYAIYLSKYKRSLLISKGIGLLAVNGYVRELIKPRKSESILRWLKDEVFNNVKRYSLKTLSSDYI